MKRILLAVTVFVAACTGSAPGPAATAKPIEPPAATAPTNPLDQMVLAFDGDESRADIKSMMDGTLKMYGLAATDENYARAGSALVALQAEDKGRGCTSCSAMEILTQMVLDGRAKGMTFAEAAAVASTELLADQ